MSALVGHFQTSPPPCLVLSKTLISQLDVHAKYENTVITKDMCLKWENAENKSFSHEELQLQEFSIA